MKIKQLQSSLEAVNTFKNPKLKWEQYPTRPHIAAHVMHTIENSYEDIENKIVADLGCGTGTLTVAAALLGSSHCIGFDIDPDALDVCLANILESEVGENTDLVLQDIMEFADEATTSRLHHSFETVILNPPFGTKNNKGADMKFLEAAKNLSCNSFYSFHKSSTRNYIKKKTEEWNVSAETLAQLRFDIPAMYKFHKSKYVDVEVDFWRFCHL